MGADIIEFNFGQHPVRSVMRDGAPWFVARDVCNVLGIVNNRDAIARLEDDEKGVGIYGTLGGPQEMSIISESGLYALIFASRKAEARAFRRWVTGEVLPQLRRTGSYDAGARAAPDFRARDLQAISGVMREARLCAGKPAARALLERFFPGVEPAPQGGGSGSGEPDEPWQDPDLAAFFGREWPFGRRFTRAGDAYEAWCAHAQERGLEPGSIKAFGLAARHYCVVRKTASGMVYRPVMVDHA